MVESKLCGVCKKIKPATEFYKRNDRPNGLQSKCKECSRLKREENREEEKKRRHNDYLKTKDHVKEVSAAYYLNHKNEIDEKNSAYGKEHREGGRERCNKSRAKHRERYNINQRIRHKERLRNDIRYRISVLGRKRAQRAVKNQLIATANGLRSSEGTKKGGSAEGDRGCSLPELVVFLESKFYVNTETGEVMTWKNYGRGGWHIDHIRPLTSFDLTNREQFIQAFHYTNLQPLWAKDNLSKYDSYDPNDPAIIKALEAYKKATGK